MLAINYWFYLYLKVSFLKKYTTDVCNVFIEIKTKTLISNLMSKVFDTRKKFNINYIGSVLKLNFYEPIALYTSSGVNSNLNK